MYILRPCAPAPVCLCVLVKVAGVCCACPGTHRKTDEICGLRSSDALMSCDNKQRGDRPLDQPRQTRRSAPTERSLDFATKSTRFFFFVFWGGG